MAGSDYRDLMKIENKNIDFINIKQKHNASSFGTLKVPRVSF